MRRIHGAIFWSLLFIFLAATAAHADTLVYADGDRVQGKQISNEGGVIVFQSPRFGELRVSEKEAAVELGERPVRPLAAETTTASPAPSVPTQIAAASTPKANSSAAHWWAPWKGRLAFATELIQDTGDHSSVVVEGKIERKWKNDEVRFEPRYEYREDNEQKTTDLLKASGYWRHDFPGKTFSLYRSVLEWNRYAFANNQFTPYFLLQQEVGVGRAFVDSKDTKLRVGISENFFNVWVLNRDLQFGKQVESAFLESEFKLPWGSRVIDRGVFYYSLEDGETGWENSLEINRQFTKTLSLGLQYQYQRSVPDLRLQDYRKLRLLLGFDF